MTLTLWPGSFPARAFRAPPSFPRAPPPASSGSTAAPPRCPELLIARANAMPGVGAAKQRDFVEVIWRVCLNAEIS